MLTFHRLGFAFVSARIQTSQVRSQYGDLSSLSRQGGCAARRPFLHGTKGGLGRYFWIDRCRFPHHAQWHPPLGSDETRDRIIKANGLVEDL